MIFLKNLMQKMTSTTPYNHEIIHSKVFFKKFAQIFFTYFKVLDKDPVHLDLFCPFVIRGPWSRTTSIKLFLMESLFQHPCQKWQK
jgi:hypothetical protein